MLRIALAFIKGNKKHIFTVIMGIALSVATIFFLFQCCGVLVNRLESIFSKGPKYDTYYMDEEENVIYVSDKMEELGYSTIYSREVATSQIDTKEMFLTVTGYSKSPESFSDFSLVEGNFPQNDNEICIDENYRLMKDCKLGDSIVVEFTDNYGHTCKREFLVSGIAYNSGDNVYCNVYITFNAAKNITEEENFILEQGDILITKAQNRTLKSIEKELIDLLACINECKGKIQNCRLNSYYDNELTNDSENMYSSAIVPFAVMSIFAFVSLFLIVYSTLTLFLNKSYEQFGMIRCIGAAKTQILQLLFVQETFCGLTGAILGIVLGKCIGAAFILKLLNLFVEVEEYTVPIWVIAVTVVLLFVAILISMLIVYFTMLRTGPLEMMQIKNKDSVSALNRENKVSTDKIDNLAFFVAQNNIIRNKSRNNLIVIVLSIVSIVVTVIGNLAASIDWNSILNSSVSIATLRINSGNYHSALSQAIIEGSEELSPFWISSETKQNIEKLDKVDSVYWSTEIYGLSDENIGLIIYSDELIEQFCKYNDIKKPDKNDFFACQIYQESEKIDSINLKTIENAEYCFPAAVEGIKEISINQWIEFETQTFAPESVGTDFVIINEAIALEIFGSIDTYTSLLIDCVDTETVAEQCFDIVSNTLSTVINLESEKNRLQEQVIGVISILFVLSLGVFVLSVFLVQNMNEENFALRKRELGMLMSIGAQKCFLEKSLIYELVLLEIRASIVSLIIVTPVSVMAYLKIREEIGIGWWGFILNILLMVVLILFFAIKIHKSMRVSVSEMLGCE